MNIWSMGLSKTDDFTLRENRIARYARALAHPARVAILRILLRQQACICGEIVDILPLSQSTVSQHLKELKEAGLIQGDVDGVRVCYCINEAAWKEAKEAFAELFGSYSLKNSKCC